MHQREQRGSFLLRNVRMFDPVQKVDQTGDILVMDGRVRAFGVVEELPPSVPVIE